MSSAPRLTSSSASASTAASISSSGACGGGGGGHQGTPSGCVRGITEGSGGHGGEPGPAAPGSLEISHRGHGSAPHPGPALPGHRQVRVGYLDPAESHCSVVRIQRLRSEHTQHYHSDKQYFQWHPTWSHGHARPTTASGNDNSSFPSSSELMTRKWVLSQQLCCDGQLVRL